MKTDLSRTRPVDPHRGTGRTTRMVDSLEPKSIVIVPNFSMVRWVERMIFERRGEDFARGVQVLVVSQEYDVHRLRGQLRPIQIDHSWFDNPPKLCVFGETLAIVHDTNTRLRASQPKP